MRDGGAAVLVGSAAALAAIVGEQRERNGSDCGGKGGKGCPTHVKSTAGLRQLTRWLSDGAALLLTGSEAIGS